MVHFTMVNRGSAPFSGAQIDSTVYAGVNLARRVGPLAPVKLLVSNDTLLVVLLRSTDSSLWSARFSPVPQPAPVKVDVAVHRAAVVRDARIVEVPDPVAR